MSDLELLFLVLALFYGWECACWLPAGCVAFTSWFGRAWHRRSPATMLGNQRGGFVFAHPLPPLGFLFTANPFPLSLAPDAVLAFVSTHPGSGWRPAPSGKLIPFDKFREAQARGRKIIINDEVFLKTISARTAHELASTLTDLAKLKSPQRATAIEKLLRKTFDAGQAEKQWRQFQQQSRNLRRLTNVLFVYLFLVTPTVVWFLGLALSWLGLLLGLFLLTLTIAVLFRRAHRALYPVEAEERFTHTLMIALSPVTTMRAHDTLSRPLLQAFHPLTLAKIFLSKTEFMEFARPVLRDVRHPALPLCPVNDPACLATESCARATLRKVMEDFLKHNGLDPDELCRAPQPADSSCEAYCPRCHAQFTSTNSTCSDCGGLELVAFDKPSAKS